MESEETGDKEGDLRGRIYQWRDVSVYAKTHGSLEHFEQFVLLVQG